MFFDFGITGIFYMFFCSANLTVTTQTTLYRCLTRKEFSSSWIDGLAHSTTPMSFRSVGRLLSTLAFFALALQSILSLIIAMKSFNRQNALALGAGL